MLIANPTLGAIAPSLDAQLKGPAELEFSRVSTDTRHIETGDLFVALKGDNFDAHDFVADAAAKGAVAAVVSHPLELDLPQLVVKDTLIALGLLGAESRNGFSGSVFGVTGSSGKTTVKEMLAAMLSQRGATLATRGNLNNHIGVPLTLLELKPEHQFAMIEMGASAVGEIAYTVRLARPDVAILNNAMGVHLEGFGSLENVVKAKGEIYEGLTDGGCGVVNLDDPHASVWLDKLQTLDKRSVTFGVENYDADVIATDLKPDRAGCFSFTLLHEDEHVNIALQILGKHNVANAAAATAAWVAAGYSLSEVKAALEQFTAVRRRLYPIHLSSGAVIIDDSYNSNPQAAKAAIDVLASLPGPRTLILGDMGELGSNEVKLHEEVGEYAARKGGVERLLATGPLMRNAVRIAASLGMNAQHFETIEGLIDYVQPLASTTGTLLVKGSLSAGMNRVVNAIEERNKA